MTVALTGVVYLYVCLKAWGGAFGLGEVTQYIGVATNLFLGISGLFKAAVDIRGNSPFLERLFEFLDLSLIHIFAGTRWRCCSPRRR